MNGSESTEFEAANALAQAEVAAECMARRSEMPNWFMALAVIFMAALLATAKVVPLGITFALFAPLLLLAVFYFSLRRKRPKARTQLKHSGRYIGWMLLFMLIGQTATWWPLYEWWQIGLKWLGLCVVLGVVLTGMRRAEVAGRIEDAHEQAF